MPLILFHSSKTMQSAPSTNSTNRPPALLAKTTELATYLKTLSPEELAKSMNLSDSMSQKTHSLIGKWNADGRNQSLAIDSFLGDMYSGLQAPSLSSEDRKYADKYLRILSGLYGLLRPLDGVMRYRLEMGYKLPRPPYSNLYSFWNGAIISQLPKSTVVFNLSSAEYTKNLLPLLNGRTVITPVFMTLDHKTGEPRQVVVHSKIARGAFVRWLIQTKCSTRAQSAHFNLIGYKYDAAKSTQNSPVYICREFEGKGLSIRKKPNLST